MVEFQIDLLDHPLMTWDVWTLHFHEEVYQDNLIDTSNFFSKSEKGY